MLMLIRAWPIALPAEVLFSALGLRMSARRCQTYFSHVQLVINATSETMAMFWPQNLSVRTTDCEGLVGRFL